MIIPTIMPQINTNQASQTSQTQHILMDKNNTTPSTKQPSPSSQLIPLKQHTECLFKLIETLLKQTVTCDNNFYQQLNRYLSQNKKIIETKKHQLAFIQKSHPTATPAEKTLYSQLINIMIVSEQLQQLDPSIATIEKNKSLINQRLSSISETCLSTLCNKKSPSHTITIEALLCLVIGINWETNIDTDTLKQIHIYNKLLIPTQIKRSKQTKRHQQHTLTDTLLIHCEATTTPSMGFLYSNEAKCIIKYNNQTFILNGYIQQETTDPTIVKELQDHSERIQCISNTLPLPENDLYLSDTQETLEDSEDEDDEDEKRSDTSSQSSSSSPTFQDELMEIENACTKLVPTKKRHSVTIIEPLIPKKIKSDIQFSSFEAQAHRYLTPHQLLVHSIDTIQEHIRSHFETYQHTHPLKPNAIKKSFQPLHINQKFSIIYSFIITKNEETVVELLNILSEKEKKHIIASLHPSLINPLISKINEAIALIEQLIEHTPSQSNSIIDISKELLKKPNTQNATMAKQWALKELSTLADSKGQAHSYESRLERVKTISQIPYGKTTPFPIQLSHSLKERTEFMNQFRQQLDRCTYGQAHLKSRLEKKLSQLISNPDAKGQCLLLLGPPGTGKTSIIRDGIAKTLGWHCAEIPLSGVEDASLLIGNGPVWEGSKPGEILRHSIRAQSENMLIFFDEVDKCGKGHHGDAVLQNLVQITDFTQNNQFRDLHIPEAPIDLSKCIFVFTANTLSTIPAPLLNRMEILEIKPQSIKEKTMIGLHYLLPKIYEQNKFTCGDIHIDNDTMTYIISNCPFEAGSRSLKRILETIIETLNLNRFLTNAAYRQIDPITPPLLFGPRARIPKSCIDECIKQWQKKEEKVRSKSIIGEVNGLYATSNGQGGILPIQVTLIDSSAHEFITTGSVGTTMLESMKVSKTVIMTLFNKKLKELGKDLSHCAIHIHATDTAQEKDGPSAGSAITIAILSSIYQKPMHHLGAITGEIDILGNITAIGGLQSKIQGAKSAGITTIYYPTQNQDDIANIQQESPELLTDLTLISIASILELATHCFGDTKHP